MPEVFRRHSRPHRPELRLQPQRRLLQRPETRRSRGIYGCRRCRSRSYCRQHHQLLVQADGRYPARRSAYPWRYELMPERHRGKTPPHPHLPHGGRQPLQGRMSSRRNQPAHRRHHQRRQPLLQRACPPLPRRLRTA